MYPKKLKVTFSKGDEATLIQLAEDIYCCPVCGSDEVDLPYANNGSASFEICPDCGIEYGFDDQVYDTDIVEVVTHEKKWKQLRSHWLEGKEVTENLSKRLQTIGVVFEETGLA